MSFPPPSSSATTPSASAHVSWNVLVIDYDSSHNWYKAFERVLKDDNDDNSNSTLPRLQLHVEQTAWELLSVASTHDRCVVDIQPSPDPIFGTPQKFHRRLDPVDFLLVRNIVRGVHGAKADYRNLLYALNYSGSVLSVNSMESLIMCGERAALNAGLNKLGRKLGRELFPMIPTVFYPNLDEARVLAAAREIMAVSSSAATLVLKAGTSCAGYGKLRCTTPSDLQDAQMLLAMGTEYYTVEQFLENVVADIRVQYIDGHVRAYERRNEGEGNGGSWKGNVGAVRYFDIDLERASADPEENDGVEKTAKVGDESGDAGKHQRSSHNQYTAADLRTFRSAAEAASGLFGGLDILSVDFLKTADGGLHVLEVNDSATGLNERWEEEDMARIVRCCLRKMRAEETCPPSAAQRPERWRGDVDGNSVGDHGKKVAESSFEERPKLAFLDGIKGRRKD